MTAHELAHILLSKPNYVVVCEDGLDPSDTVEVTRAEETIATWYDEDINHHEGTVIRIG